MGVLDGQTTVAAIGACTNKAKKAKFLLWRRELWAIEIKPARRKVESQLKELARIEEMVVSDPETMRGTPIFKGSRILVDLVADMLAQGAMVDELLEGYPTLNKEKHRHRATVHARVSAAWASQPPPLAGCKAAE